ncbi:ERF family protein [Acinetobacter venetianus]|uniref:ERF family protein n=1 Tax=Acinetobacter venetianus TaxID=52133 RepID=UPI003A923A48
MTTKNKIYQAINNIHRVIVKFGIASNGLFQGRFENSPIFSYQKIDDIYEFISPLMAEENIICLPFVVDAIESVTQTSTGRLIRTKVTVEYTFTHAEDGSSFKVRTIGEETDTGGKSSSKAMTSAHKAALKQIFLIPKHGSDTPKPSNHAVQNQQFNQNKPARQEKNNIRTVNPEEQQQPKLITSGQAKWINEQLAALGTDIPNILNHYQINDFAQLKRSDYEKLNKRILNMRKELSTAQK